MRSNASVSLGWVSALLGLAQVGWVEWQDGDDAQRAAAPAVDRDGVEKLYPDAPGLALGLGKGNPNRLHHLSVDNALRMRRRRDGNIDYWTASTYAFEYASGGNGKTARIHISASEAAQRYTWQAHPEYLADPLDFGSQEFTAYVRVRGVSDPRHAAITLKIRGGEHTQRDPSLASCTMMTFASTQAPAVSRFGKELNHPDHDYVDLPLRSGSTLRDGHWVGLKLVSVQDPDDEHRVINRLYVDDAPFERDGTPRNDFRLLSEYVDSEGKSTGRYDTLVNWGGNVSTLRVDGVDAVDVAILSARAVEFGERAAARR